MKPCLLFISLQIFLNNACHAQTNRLFLRCLDAASQSNVIVKVSNGWLQGNPCPTELTNDLANTNLFSVEEQKMLFNLEAKYKNINVGNGPAGTMLEAIWVTNNLWKINTSFVGAPDTNSILIYHYIYTNQNAHEEIGFKQQRWDVVAKFRTSANDGYDVSISGTGGKDSIPLIDFWQIKNGLPNGLVAYFYGNHCNYLFHYTNGLVVGRYLAWLPDGQLHEDAEFKDPFDLKAHLLDIRKQKLK